MSLAGWSVETDFRPHGDGWKKVALFKFLLSFTNLGITECHMCRKHETTNSKPLSPFPGDLFPPILQLPRCVAPGTSQRARLSSMKWRRQGNRGGARGCFCTSCIFWGVNHELCSKIFSSRASKAVQEGVGSVWFIPRDISIKIPGPPAAPFSVSHDQKWIYVSAPCCCEEGIEKIKGCNAISFGAYPSNPWSPAAATAEYLGWPQPSESAHCI